MLDIKHHLVDPASDFGRNLEPDLHHAIGKRLELAKKDSLFISGISQYWIDLGRRAQGHERELFAQIGRRIEGSLSLNGILVLECGFDARGRMRVLLGQYTKVRRMDDSGLSDLTKLIWDSDTAQNAEGVEVHTKVREAIALRLGKLDDDLRGATHIRREHSAPFNRGYFDDAPPLATSIKSLFIPEIRTERPDISDT